MAPLSSSKLLLLSAVLLDVAWSSVLPTSHLFSRQSTTPDGTCGGGNSYLCPTTSSTCCSQWGWCGDTAEYCGTGCQAAYGSCTGTGTGTGGGTTPTPTPTVTAPSGGRSQLGSVPYGQFITGCTQPGVVALTFDDGPYIYGPALLDLLASNGVKATFFMNGQNWADILTPDNEAYVKRIDAEGHQVASHTWSHPYLDTLSTADMTTQMTELEAAFTSILGKFPTYMRPPYLECGSTCLSVMDGLGYHIITTNLDTEDWANTANIQASEDNFSNAINPSDIATDSWIVLAHEVYPTTVNTLVQDMIDTLKAKGYTTATVGECLGDPAANWYRT